MQHIYECQQSHLSSEMICLGIVLLINMYHFLKRGLALMADSYNHIAFHHWHSGEMCIEKQRTQPPFSIVSPNLSHLHDADIFSKFLLGRQSGIDGPDSSALQIKERQYNSFFIAISKEHTVITDFCQGLLPEANVFSTLLTVPHCLYNIQVVPVEEKMGAIQHRLPDSITRAVWWAFLSFLIQCNTFGETCWPFP